jgi:hypothetical protein
MRSHVLDTAFYLKCGECTITRSVGIVISCLSMPMRSCVPQPNRMSHWLNFRRNACMWCWEREIQSDLVKNKSSATTCSTSERRYSWTSVCVNVYKEFCLCVRVVCVLLVLCVWARAHRKQKCTGAVRILEDDITRDDLPTLLAHPIYSTIMMQVCMHLFSAFF